MEDQKKNTKVDKTQKENKAPEPSYKESDTVTVVAVKGAKHMKDGKEYEVGGLLANILIRTGRATAK